MIKLISDLKFKGIIPQKCMPASRSCILLLTIAIISLASCSPWRNAAKRNMTVVFYNVENLYDLENDPFKQDDEYTPAGEKSWNREKYQKKLNDVSKAISSINEGDLPEIVGLCGVENRKVIQDLIVTGLLSLGKYSIIHYESPDIRGIDCALIYRPDEFKVLYHSPVKVFYNDDPDHNSSDILYVMGRTRNWEEFHIFVNHWSSRLAETETSEAKRLAAAGILKTKIDSIMSVRPKAHIVIMGNIDDEPFDKSLAEVLEAHSPDNDNAKLVNLMIPEYERGRGSFNCQGKWKMTDHLIVTPGLLDSKGFQCVERKGYIFHQDWMEYTNGKGNKMPRPTYVGDSYWGGASDHFPVYFRLRR